MADFNFQLTPTAPPKQQSLADMLNMASAVQQYQQAQQMNPLALQKAQMEVQQAQQMNPLAIQKAQQEVQLLLYQVDIVFTNGQVVVQ